MKKLIMLAALMLPTQTFAVLSCSGTVVKILDWPGKCEGNMAYMLDSTNGSWICAQSTKSESMVLSAYMSGRRVSVRLNADLPCDQIDQYHMPIYTIVQD